MNSIIHHKRFPRQSIQVIGCLLAILVPAVRPARVLLLAPPLYSQCIHVASIGHALSERGHSVWAYVPEGDNNSEKCFDTGKIQRIEHKANNADLSMMSKLKADDISKPGAMIQLFRNFSQTYCSHALADNDALKSLLEVKFDIAIVNTLPAYRCYLLIPYKYNIPVVSAAAMHFWTDSDKPFLPYLEPYFYSGYPVRMTFLQAIGNTFSSIISPIFTMWKLRNEDIKSFAPELSFVDYFLLIRSAQLFIQDDDIILSGAITTMPNTIRTGGFSHREPKSLPQNFHKFCSTTNSATHGVIVVTFGSLIYYQSGHVNEQFIESFNNVNQSVLWRSNYKIETMGSSHWPSTNIMTSEWLPQNDVLGHKNTVLFISHCGRRSFYEALYHAVPVLCIPFSNDQPTIASQVVYYGIGVKLEREEISADSLREAISKIVSNNSYTENVRRLSAVYRDLHPEKAGVVASRAIEHVIKYGGKHLRPNSRTYSWMSFLMLDTWILLEVTFFILLLILFSFYKVCFCVFGMPPKSKLKVQ